MSLEAPNPNIYFYINSSIDFSDFNSDFKYYWDWAVKKYSSIKNTGPFDWTVYTYYQLRRSGFSCSLVTELPSEGIVITHGDFFSFDLIKKHPKLFFVMIKPDRPLRSWAHYFIVQNKQDPIFGAARIFCKAAYIDYWPQPSLIPRDPKRGHQVLNIAYIGNIEAVASELLSGSFKQQLSRRGFNWLVASRDNWNNYSHIDAIVSVRSFKPNNKRLRMKPGSKLVNAWIAGTPAILGAEPAYRRLKESSLDYIEAPNINDIMAALERLRNDSILYSNMVNNGFQRARDFGPEMIRKQWEAVILEKIIPSYQNWLAAPPYKKKFFFVVLDHLRFITKAKG